MQKRSLKQKCLAWLLSLAVAMTFIPLTAGFAFADEPAQAAEPDMFINLEKANGSDFAGDEVKVYVNLDAPWQDGDTLATTQITTGEAMKPVVSNLNCKWAGTFTEENNADPNGEPYFTVDYGEGNWTDPGEYTLKVIANENAAPFEAEMKGTKHVVKFKGTYELPCKIIGDPKDLAASTVTFSEGSVNKNGEVEIPYDGQLHQLVPSEVKASDDTVIDPSYYEVTYPNDSTNAYRKVGEFDIVITAKEGNAGGYVGSITKTVSIMDFVTDITVYSQKGVNGARTQEQVFKYAKWGNYALSNPIQWGYGKNSWTSKYYIPVETLLTESGLAVGDGKDMIDLWTNSEPEHYFKAPQTVAELQQYKYTTDGQEVLGIFGGEFTIPAFLVLDCENNSANPRGAVGRVDAETPTAGNMSPSAVSEIALVSMDIKGLTASVKNATYTGKALKPAVTVKDGKDTVPVTVKYSNNTKAGKGTAVITAKADSAYYGTVTKTFTIAKAAQKITKVTPTAKTYKAKKKTKKLAKTYSFALKATSTGPVKVTYAKANKVGASKITVAKTGKVTVKKGLKKGIYKVKVKASKAANTNYKAASKTVTIKIVVK